MTSINAILDIFIEAALVLILEKQYSILVNMKNVISLETTNPCFWNQVQIQPSISVAISAVDTWASHCSQWATGGGGVGEPFSAKKTYYMANFPHPPPPTKPPLAVVLL